MEYSGKKIILQKRKPKQNVNPKMIYIT